MNSAYRYFLFLFSLFLLSCVYPGNSFAWDPAVQENVIVFDEGGEPMASYHTGDWVRIVDAEGKATFETWNTGSPPSQASQASTLITFSPGMVAVPNFTSQSSTPPSVVVPEVSLYSFDAALFPSTNPGDIPGLSTAPPSGTYQNTVELTITAKSLSGTAGIELKNSDGSWQSIGEDSATLYISRDRTLTIRAVNNGVYSPERILTYTVQQPILVDSDGDGLPDIWEIAHGLNPLDNSANSTHNSPDSDGDGISDVDEILRGSNPLDPDSVPMDFDGDGWSDWDESNLRGTNPHDSNETPTATRLYEVETILSGRFFGYNNDPVANSDYRIETLGQRVLAETVSDAVSSYSARIPLGSEAVIRVVNSSNDGFIYKRYIPSVADPLFSDLVFDETDCTGDISTWHEQWQAALVQFLAASLVTQTADFHVTTASMLPLALLERQMELLIESVPQEVVDDFTLLYPGQDPHPWLAFASHGHRPDSSTLSLLLQVLGNDRPLAWDAVAVQGARSINVLMEDLYNLAGSGCHSLRTTIEEYYSLMSPDENIEEEVSRLLQEEQGSYLAGLFLLYSLDSLESYPEELCTLLSPLADSDGDGVVNGEETPAQDNIAGFSDPLNADSDGDGLTDGEDNCPFMSNPEQRDNDQDAMGDVCDQDDDNDGLSDGLEMLLGSNPFNADSDGDGVGDAEQWSLGMHPGLAVYITDMVNPSNQTGQIISGYRYPGAFVSVFVGMSAVGIPAVETGDTGWSVSLSGLDTEGSYLLTVVAVSGALSGKDMTTLVVDFTAPTVTISSPVDGAVASTDTPLLTFTSDEAGSTDVWLDGVLRTIASGENIPRQDIGSHHVRVEVIDEAGNTGFAEVTFTIDESSLDRLISVSSSSIDFGVLTGGALVEEVITVSNYGQTPVTIGVVGSGDSLAAPFTVGSETCSGQTLAFAETCTVTVQVQLGEVGVYSDSFDLPNNDPDRDPLTITVYAEMEDSFPWLLFLPAMLGNGM